MEEPARNRSCTGWSGAAAAAFSAGDADRRFPHSDGQVCSTHRYGRADVGDAGGGRRVSSSHEKRLGLRERAHADRRQPTSITRTRRCSTSRSTCRTRGTRRLRERRGRDRSRSCSNISRGRAFVLFTSYQQMRLIYDRVSLEIEYPTLLQGTGPRNALLDEFRTTPNCVLFATSSFWQGVDVPGEQLSCVIIDKLPFAVPSDPVVEARVRAVREERRQSVLRLPDSAGRDRAEAGLRPADPQPDRIAACLALLDNRITKQRYGQVFFDSLPDYALPPR